MFSQAFPIIGNVTALALFCSPVLHSYKIFRNNTIGSYNTLPNVFAALNCLSWVLYGVIQLNWYLITVNAVGLVLSLFNFMMTLGPLYSTGNYNNYLLYVISWLCANITAQLFIFCSCVLVVTGDAKQLVMGYTCIFYLLIFYASPLQLLFQVIKEKDARHFYMPFILTCLANSVAWAFYGFAISDNFVAIPNSFGILVSLVQLLLSIMYKKESRKEELLPIDAMDLIEE